MVFDKLKEKLMGKRKKNKRKSIAKGVAAGAAVAGLVETAKKLHEKGYDEKALNMLRDSANKLKDEARNLQKKVKQKRTPDEDLNSFEKKVRRKTKDEIKEFAMEEYGVELSTNDLKDEMVEQFISELENR